MRLDVCLVDKHDAVFVAEVIPAAVGRVVRVADGVYVVLLHKPNVGKHEVFCNGAPQLRVRVAVDALDEYGFAVEAILSVFDFGSAEAHVAAECLEGFAVFVFEFYYECIEVGMFGAPCFDAGERLVEIDTLLCR